MSDPVIDRDVPVPNFDGAGITGKAIDLILPAVFGCLHLNYGRGYCAGFKRFGLPLGGLPWKK